MALTGPERRMQAQDREGLHWLGRAAAIGASAAFLSWPAFFNGFPLLYPDSMTYLADGPPVARAVFLHQPSDYYGVRSFFYSLGILPCHWNLNPWPIVALQCMLVAWVAWLAVRSITPRHTVSRYLIVMAFLSLLTSASWYAAFIMPDILGPLLYLSVYLLVFARDTLGRAERISLYPIVWWAATAHATHFLLAVCLCMLLAAFAVFRPRWQHRLVAVGEATAILALAAAAQMALHGYLYGHVTLNGERRPYLMARIISDGPGLWYLEQNCSHLQWTVCNHLQQLSTDTDAFLWSEDGIFERASDEDRVRLSNEEMPLVLAAVRAYPRQQFSRSAANFEGQLGAFGCYGFDAGQWTLTQFDSVLPSSRARYIESRQARDALPLDLVSEIQWWTVVASLAVIAGLIPILWRRHSERLAGLGLVVVSMVVINALVTGVLSVVDDRYGCRVIWLLPLLAGLAILDWLHQREAAADLATQQRSAAQI